MLLKIDRYILKECIAPFFFGLFIFLVIFLVDLMMGLIELTVTKGISIYDVGRIFIYSLPALLVLVLPMACLLSILMGFSRLSSDSEIISIMAGGISFYRIVKWPVLTAFFISILAFLLNDHIVPWTNNQVSEIRKTILMKDHLPKIIEKDFFDAGSGKKLIVDKVDNENEILHNVKMFEYMKKNNFPIYLEAEKSQLKKGYWNFYKGSIQEYNTKGFKDYIIKFDVMKRPYNNVSIISSSSKSPREMTYKELKNKINMYRENGIKKLSAMEFELYEKISLPFACFVFTLLAAPLAVKSSRSGTSTGMGLSIVIIFFYYVIMSLGRALSTGTTISPFLGAWLQNIVIAIIGIVFFILKK